MALEFFLSATTLSLKLPLCTEPYDPRPINSLNLTSSYGTESPIQCKSLSLYAAEKLCGYVHYLPTKVFLLVALARTATE